MPKPLAAILSLALLFAAVGPAEGARGGGRLLESYIARLSAQDHVNSYGERLTSAAAIIRQDRANFHVFGRQDSEDEGDAYFSSASNRALMEAMLNRGSATPGVRRAIVYGEPLVRVDIYPGRVIVTLLDG